MFITFKSNKLRNVFNQKTRLIQEYGKENARKIIMLRMSVLQAAINLEQIPKIKPERCHELKNNRKGTFAVILKQPYRLIFKPDMKTLPKLDDGGIDLEQVVSIQILGVEDYH